MQKINAGICAIVPVYNASDTLPELTERLTRVLGRFATHRIVLVDDGSTDGSARVIAGLHAQYAHVTGVLLEKNFGQQSAIFCGLHECACDYAVIIDDDLEQDPEDIMALYDEAQKGYDVVYGVGGCAERSLLRRIGSRLRDALFAAITRKPRGVKVSSFRIMTKETVDAVLRADTRFVYISLEILRHTRNIQSIAIPCRPAAPSNYRPAMLMRLLLKMMVYYGPHPFKRLRKKGPCYEVKKILAKEQAPCG